MIRADVNDIIDIAIIVPKEDELRALSWAFDIQFRKSSGSLPNEKLYYKFTLPSYVNGGTSDISIAVVYLNEQGNSITSSTTEQIFSQLDPTVLFLTGTAAGIEGTVQIGHVVVSMKIIDAQEWRLEEKASPRVDQHDPPEKMLVDVRKFIGQNLVSGELFRTLPGIKKLIGKMDVSLEEIFKTPITIHDKCIASSNYLHLNREILKKILDIDKRIYCIDMESGGFGKVCKKYIQKQWLVIRGISDYGNPESKKEEYRIASAASAAIFVRKFIETGLIECHPRQLRIPESLKAELSSRNPYTKYTVLDVISTLKGNIKDRLGIDLSRVDLGRSLSIADYEAICIARGADRTRAHAVLSSIREDYFTKKYLHYTYENDLRGLVPYWANEVKDILGMLAIELKASTVLDVGIGNGLEAPYLFGEVGRLIGVDVSKEILDKAKECFPSLKIVHNPAENMCDIETNSIDVYISLRTYQSSLFDISLALREAQRVLKNRGIIILSIANGFVDIQNNMKRGVRGLLYPGSRTIVDKSSPRKLMDQIVEKLNDLGFEFVSFSATKTDIYIWGQIPSTERKGDPGNISNTLESQMSNKTLRRK
jgi:nucleoside phosphorylase/ubiquinone/menaquinone biosynthesis C-methylase UbiE